MSTIFFGLYELANVASVCCRSYPAELPRFARHLATFSAVNAEAYRVRYREDVAPVTAEEIVPAAINRAGNFEDAIRDAGLFHYNTDDALTPEAAEALAAILSTLLLKAREAIRDREADRLREVAAEQKARKLEAERQAKRSAAARKGAATRKAKREKAAANRRAAAKPAPEVPPVATPTNEDRERLGPVFDRVRDQADWRAPIDCLVAAPDPEVRALIAEAVEFFTATPATFVPTIRRGVYRLTADGYRNGPAGP